jgi:IS5 family transposase
VLRPFCRVYWEPVRDDTTLLRWANRIGPETVEQLHRRVVALAREEKLTRGRKLRGDTTVVHTNIHPPADSTLLTDGVRGISRLVKRAQALLERVGKAGQAGAEAFRDRTRSMRQRGSQLRRIYRSKQEKDAKREQLQQVYEGLIAIAKRSRA